MADGRFYVKIDEKIIEPLIAEIQKHSVAYKLCDQFLKKRKVRSN